MEHLTQAQLESLVMGEGTDDLALAHLAACPQCSARLAREARLELVLQEIARDSGPGVVSGSGRDAVWSRHGWLVAAAAAGVVAVGLLIALLARGPKSLQTPSAPAEAITADAPESIETPETPGLQDPRILGPGATVLPPTSLCRWVTAPSSPAPGM